MDIVNSREVSRFLEASKLTFLPEYGPKLKEDYIMVKHLPKIQKDDVVYALCLIVAIIIGKRADSTDLFRMHGTAWAVLKPCFLAFLEDPFEDKLLDIVVFDVLPPSDGNGGTRVCLAKDTKEKNPLRCGFTVSILAISATYSENRLEFLSCRSRTLKLRTSNKAKVHDWVVSVNDAAVRPPEGWCYPHRFCAFSPLRGLNEDGSQAQWYVQIFITGWWLSPELYLRHPFSVHDSSRLDIYILLYKEVPLALKINSVYRGLDLCFGRYDNPKQEVNDFPALIWPSKDYYNPDNLSTGIYLWSHHEKIVIVDYQICYLGVLDLCFGRYDIPTHEFNDFLALIWPAKVYYNPRESEPNSWEDTTKDELDHEKYAQIPWHDIHCALWGPLVVMLQNILSSAGTMPRFGFFHIINWLL
ncbi:Phospholipase D zeta 1 [Nymphaea thermarum]|nr:Phospholipase D zeta 1 [Nymphaea thermarum]